MLAASGALLPARPALLAASGAPAIPGVPAGGEPKVVDGRAIIDVTLADAPDSQAGEEAVRTLRENVHAVPGANADDRRQALARRGLRRPASYDPRVLDWTAEHPGRSWLSEGLVRSLERGGGQDGRVRK